ncbi:Neuronal acetylcholine receptor subunit alpha-3 [Acropora cervicornis]|uniref:Neuronal acetylcholine receptor subunit alpha-3 n=1 Tax=Acropora cervicornis TaxID=6130 RepID=A0AAD9QXJ4_ACRCE|nr:Neuronal acetylcholine receptor subunit alpha-3 [Acropora cervicornis]
MEILRSKLLAFVLAISLFTPDICSTNFTSRGENHLLEDLFSATRYNKRVRPVRRSEEVVNVTFGLVVREIVDLDDKNQLLITRAEIREYWHDPLMVWNPSEYDGITFISVHPKDIWLPDIVLYNNAGTEFGSGMTRTKAVINHDGLVSINAPTIIESSCKIHVTNYPFDQQNCKLKFGSWTHEVNRLALTLERPSADLHEYSPSVEWELIGVPGEFHSVKYACCDQPFDDVTYNVRIKRRPLYYTMYLIIPCAMISILTLLVFLLPPDCNERMTVGMAILVTLSFFFIMVAENMPATSEAVPLVGMYYTVTMIEVSSAFFMTCWVLRFHHMNPTEGEVPKWVKVYLLGFGAKLFRFNFGNRTNFNEVQNEKKQGDLSLTENNPPGRKVNDNTTKETSASNQPINEKSNGNVISDKKSSSKILAENVQYQMILEARQEEWRKAALVLNHICIWVYLFAVVVSFMAIFLQAPL